MKHYQNPIQTPFHARSKPEQVGCDEARPHTAQSVLKRYWHPIKTLLKPYKNLIKPYTT